MNLLRFVLLSLLLVIAMPTQAQDGSITTEEGASSAVRSQSDAAIATRIRDIIHELEAQNTLLRQRLHYTWITVFRIQHDACVFSSNSY